MPGRGMYVQGPQQTGECSGLQVRAAASYGGWQAGTAAAAGGQQRACWATAVPGQTLITRRQWCWAGLVMYDWGQGSRMLAVDMLEMGSSSGLSPWQV